MPAALVALNFSAPFRFKHLPEELVTMILSMLERPSLVVMMRVDKDLFERTRAFVWYDVSGIDALLLLLPCTKPDVKPLSSRHSNAEEEGEDEDEEKLVDAVLVGSYQQKQYTFSTPIPAQCITRFREYAALVRILRVHASLANASFQGLNALGFPDPITPNLKHLVVCPMNGMGLHAADEVKTIVKFCCPPSLEAFSMAATLDVEKSNQSDHWTLRRILSFLSAKGYRFNQLELDMPCVGEPQPYPYTLLQGLTRLSLDSGSSPTLPWQLLATLPNLSHLRLRMLHSVDFQTVSVEKVDSPEVPPPFPSLQHIEVFDAFSAPVAKLLRFIPPGRLCTIQVNILRVRMQEQLVLGMLESLGSHWQTLRALRLGFGGVALKMDERCVAALSTLMELTHFEVLGMAGDCDPLLDVFRCLPSIKGLIIPSQAIDLNGLIDLTNSCPCLTKLRIRLLAAAPSSSNSGPHRAHEVPGAFTVINSLATGTTLSHSTLDLGFRVVGKYNQEWARALALFLVHRWRYVVVSPPANPDGETIEALRQVSVDILEYHRNIVS